MEEDSKKEILTRMYRERGNNFGKFVSKTLAQKEKDINSKLESKLQAICDNEAKINDIMDDIYLIESNQRTVKDYEIYGFMKVLNISFENLIKGIEDKMK